MCFAAAAVARTEHQPAMKLMLLASYFYPVQLLPPSPTMTTNNHQFFQMVSFVHVPVDNFDTADMDYSIVSSAEKQTRNNDFFSKEFTFVRPQTFDFALF